MSSLNKVQLIGNLTANPEIRETPNGQKVATMGVATTRTWKDTAGAKQEQTEYHNVVLWRGLAEITERYLTKGQKVYIEGYLQTRSWEDQAGSKKYKTEIVAEQMFMLTPKGGASSSDEFAQPTFGDSAPAATAPKRTKSAPAAEKEIDINDIPF